MKQPARIPIGVALLIVVVGVIGAAISVQAAPAATSPRITKCFAPPGLPCAPFKNKPRVIKYLRAKLLYNGYRPAMTFAYPNPRQIRFHGIQDGDEQKGTVVKSGTRQIVFQLRSTHGEFCDGFGFSGRICYWSDTFTFNLPFVA